MKEPQYLSGIPVPTTKGRKRSAHDSGKSKVGESSKQAEPKKLKAGESSKPATDARTVCPIRASPTAASPPPKSTDVGPSSLPDTPVPPRPPTVIPRSHLWSKGITEELSIALLPPTRYQEPVPLREVDVRDVQELGNAFLRGAGLTQSFLTLHHKYAETAAELKRARSERDEALKQWQIASNEFQAREVQLGKVEFALKETQGLLADSNVIIEGFKAAQASSEEQLKAITAERDRVKAEGEASSAHLTAEITRLQELLLGSVVEAFENSLAQIRALNPGVELNTTGHHFRAYVDDGQFVPYVEPPANSETRVDGDAAVLEAEQGEEVSTAPKLVG